MTYPTTYDTQIKSAMLAWLPFLNWNWGKAQLIAESGLNRMAVSPSGAQGLAQFMPQTWYDIVCALKYPEDASAFDPVYAIPAYAYYMRKMWNSWTKPRPPEDRLILAQASYNAGFGNILAAQTIAKTNDAHGILAALPQVTGPANSAQTLSYIDHIAQAYAELT